MKMAGRCGDTHGTRCFRDDAEIGFSFLIM